MDIAHQMPFSPISVPRTYENSTRKNSDVNVPAVNSSIAPAPRSTPSDMILSVINT